MEHEGSYEVDHDTRREHKDRRDTELHDSMCMGYFFFNDTATTEIYTLSLHDALPIWLLKAEMVQSKLKEQTMSTQNKNGNKPVKTLRDGRSEEHTSELQSH